MKEYKLFNYFAMTYWNEMCLELYGNISNAAVEFVNAEPRYRVSTLIEEINLIIDAGLLPEKLTKASRKEYGQNFPSHHRYITQNDANDILSAIGTPVQ